MLDLVYLWFCADQCFICHWPNRSIVKLEGCEVVADNHYHAHFFGERRSPHCRRQNNHCFTSNLPFHLLVLNTVQHQPWSSSALLVVKAAQGHVPVFLDGGIPHRLCSPPEYLLGGLWCLPWQLKVKLV
ncbi:hypothetical protein OPV22_024500 [Ensete ventricosum]|uniref:Secreted protein n=1 Tax=Ensete ventricosum TaxID=4639 RepID=A0AAV8QD32_ENSVE|nr:hypothetical protein OPV22_024500 [Ensete ventricosum]